MAVVKEVAPAYDNPQVVQWLDLVKEKEGPQSSPNDGVDGAITSRDADDGNPSPAKTPRQTAPGREKQNFQKQCLKK